MSAIPNKTCSECNETKPVTLFSGDMCTSCDDKHYEERVKRRTVSEERERRKAEMIASLRNQSTEDIQPYQPEEKPKAKPKAKPKQVKPETDPDAPPIPKGAGQAKERLNKEMAQQEIAKRALSRQHLLPFVKRFNEDYEAGWVHADICQRLEKFSQDIVDKKAPRLMLFCPPRHGKELAHSTPVLTQNRGWTTHGELVVGDKVFHPSGKAIEVVALADTEHEDDYVVSFSNGDPVRCHENHEWDVYDRRTRKWMVRSTHWLANTKLTNGVIGKRGGRYNIQIQNIEAVQYTEKELPIDPYYLGAWLGDGTKGCTSIVSHPDNTAVFDRIESRGVKNSCETTHKTTTVIKRGFGHQNIGKKLQDLGIFRDKFIPETYLRSSIEQRIQLMAGLIDTDGHCDRTSRIRYTTTDNKLAETFFDLATGLGFRPNKRVVPPHLTTSGIQGTKDVHVIGFQPTMDIPCALERKSPKRLIKQRRVAITSVSFEPNGEKGRCIQVDSPDGLYLVGRQLIPTHNSELASKTFPAWHLGRNPKHEVIACSYSADLAMDFSRKVRGLLRETSYSTMFPECALDKSSQSAERWNTEKGGGFVAAGVGGGITGRGAHLAIIDDPLKNREEADNPTTRQKLKDWFTSTLYTRLAPGGGLLIILTRWHDDDLAGWLLKESEEHWDVVKYPAIAEIDEKFRKKGQALHPARYPLDALDRIKKAVGPRDWSALFQQNPVPDEGMYFNKSEFKYYLEHPAMEDMRIYQAWDLAIGTKECNDFSVGVTIGVAPDQRVYILDVCRGHWGSFDLVENIIDQAEKYNPSMVGIEKGQIEMAIGPILRKRMRERSAFFPLELLRTGRQDKMMRARPLQGRIQQGMVLFPSPNLNEWTQVLLTEMLRFPAGTHDDQVDALSWTFQMLEMFAVVVRSKPKPKRGWRDKIDSRMAAQHRRTFMAS